MSTAGTRIRTTATPTARDVQEAARAWAAATATRDGEAVPGPWQDKVAGIHRRLELPSATMIFAERSTAVDGFALSALGADGPELFYLAVHPRAWGRRLATQLLAAVDGWALERGHDEVRLWVIEDNERARSVYESAGWAGTDQVSTPECGARAERLYLRKVRP